MKTFWLNFKRTAAGTGIILLITAIVVGLIAGAVWIVSTKWAIFSVIAAGALALLLRGGYSLGRDIFPEVQRKKCNRKVNKYP